MWEKKGGTRVEYLKVWEKKGGTRVEHGNLGSGKDRTERDTERF